MNDYDVDAIRAGIAPAKQVAIRKRGEPLDTSRWKSKPRRVEPGQHCNKKAIERLRRIMTLQAGGKKMNGATKTVPLVNYLSEVPALTPPTIPTPSNGKPALFSEVDGVALGLGDFSQTEVRKRMMAEAACLLERGFVPGPSVAMENEQRGLWMFDSVRFKQLRPTLMERAQDRASAKLRELFEDAEQVAEQAAAAHVRIVSSTAVAS